jgi:hypothetical protein
MATARLFIPQGRLDEWAAQENIEIDEHRLDLDGGNAGLELSPAVRFMQEVTGEGDPHGLLGKVKTTAQLEQMGADHMHDSVLVEESAYEVLEGYLATPVGASAARQPAEAPAGEPEAEGGSEADELARLLIEKLD